jgi:hypothetical protein
VIANLQVLDRLVSNVSAYERPRAKAGRINGDSGKDVFRGGKTGVVTLAILNGSWITGSVSSKRTGRPQQIR